MIKTVIFDYNGTLVDDTGKMAILFSNTLEKTGLSAITLKEFKEKFALPIEKLATNFGIPEEKLEEAKNNFVDEWKNYEGGTPLFPDTKEVLEYLKSKKIKIVILTAYMQERLEKELQENKIMNFFSEKICDGQKVEAINKFIGESKLKPEEILYIGDTELDVEAGKQAGTKTAGFTGGVISRERLKKIKPDYLIDSLSEIKKIIEE